MYKLLSMIVFLATTLAQDDANTRIESIIEQLINQKLQSSSTVSSVVNNNDASLSPAAAGHFGSERPLLALILHCSQPGASRDAVCPDACRRWPQYCYYAIAAENGVPGTCKLPPYPSVGDYTIEGIELSGAGHLADFTLHYSCPPGYKLNGYHPSCVSGTWNADFPNCTSDDDKSCLTTENVAGECVPYFLCGANGTIINDGVTIIDSRENDDECKSYLDTCCLHPDHKSPDDPGISTPPPENRVGCGWRNPDGLGLRLALTTVGLANFGEFPWMVAILEIEPANHEDPNGPTLNVYVGGGSLIHPSVVLTAAKGVSSGSKLRVRAGEWDTQSSKELYPHQDRDVKESVTHKDFNKRNLFYDIGLLFLALPVDLAPNVGVACLPNLGVRAAAGKRCQVTGWGKDRFGQKGRYQVELKRVELPVVDHARCQQALRKTRLGKYFELHRSFMCAGGEAGADTCKGDGGSPLVCPSEYEKDRYIQHGIVSWGIGCGDEAPGVYVDVGHLRSWIDDQVRSHGYDEKVYTYID